MSVVTADLLASPEAFADYRQVAFDVDDRHAIKMLEVASSLIRSKTRQHITEQTYTDQELFGTWDSDLQLPQRPVTSLAALAVRYRYTTEFTTLEDLTVTRRGCVYRACGWGGPYAVVKVTYTAGYAEVPSDIEAICLSIAGRAYANPNGLAIEGSEQIGNYSYTTRFGTTAEGKPIGLTEHEAQVIEDYS